MRTAIAAAALLAVSTGNPRAQDVETGKASFRKCVLCHSIGKNAKNKVGPELNGLDGRKRQHSATMRSARRLRSTPRAHRRSARLDFSR
jgi:cytochrome c2